MVFTTYLGKVRYIPEGRKIFFITRFLPRDSTADTLPRNMEWLPELSPDPEYVMSKDHDKVVDNIIDKYHNDSKVKSAYDRVAKLAETDDIFLVCYEHQYEQCHRTVVRHLLETQYDLATTEWMK